MGLFTSKCINPACGERVRKGAAFCPKCGQPAPKGKAVCGACRAEVSTAATFCHRCGAELARVARPQVRAGRWARQADEFAVRADAADVKGWLRKPLTVEDGTRALLFQKGRFRGELPAGRYDMGGFLKRLNHFMIDQAAGVVLVDAGEVALDLENGGLRTADGFEVGTVARLVLRVSRPEAMLPNLFKDRIRVTMDDLEAELAGEVQMVLAGIVAGHGAEALFTAADVRTGIEQQLRSALAPALARMGMEIVRLQFIRFVGEKVEELRRLRGEVAARRERVGLEQQLREALTKDRMDSFRSEQEFADFVRQQQHEGALGEALREDEAKRLYEKLKHGRDVAAALNEIEVEEIRTGARIEQERKLAEADHQRKLAEARTKAEVAAVEREQDAADADAGIARLAKMDELEHAKALREQELEARTLADRSKATAEALLTIVDGPAAERIARLEEFRAKQNMTPDQVLALAAEANPEAARALAARYANEGQLAAERARMLEEQFAAQQRQADQHVDRMERVMHSAMKQSAAAAGGRAVGVPLAATGVCPFCNRALASGDAFCPHCGRKQA